MKPGPAKGTRITPEHRRNIGLGQVGKVLTKEHRKAISETMTGRTFSVLTRHRMSEAQQRRREREKQIGV